MRIGENPLARRICSAVRRLRSDQRGSVAIMAGLFLAAAGAMVGLVIQEAMIYRTQRALQASTTLAALAGAQDINTGKAGTAITMANVYSALNPISGQTVTMASGYPMLKCLKSTGVPCSGPDSANAIVVKQQADMSLVFGHLFGAANTTITATATAGMKGGSGKSLDVMLIVDTTASMNNADSNCSVSKATRITCAMAGARALLQGFQPSQVQVGLMLFPGVTNSSQVPYEYDCATSPAPTIAKYNASPVYQIIGLSTDYKTSDTTSSLNTSSNLLRTLQGGPSGCQQGVAAIGGVGTYYADVITAAQTALTTNGRTGVQKVIIFLSDGDASASASNVPTGKATNQCHQGITAAQAATSAGTWVYTAAYGAATSATSSCSTDSPRIDACSTLQQMASTPAMFFSDGATSCTSTVNQSAELVTLFTNIGTSLTPARLLPNNTM